MLAGLLLMLAVPVFASEETDYDALFAGGRYYRGLENIRRLKKMRPE